jgi:predicted dehydrogenase
MNIRVSRREFIGKGSAVTAAVLAGAPRIAPQGRDKIKIGVVGCGKRGTGAMKECLKASENVSIIALADLFKDRLDASRQRLDEHKDKGFEVEDKNCFLGFDAYKKVLDLPIDMVLLTTPPGFRPVHFEAAVEAGKHVFLE